MYKQVNYSQNVSTKIKIQVRYFERKMEIRLPHISCLLQNTNLFSKIHVFMFHETIQA